MKRSKIILTAMIVLLAAAVVAAPALARRGGGRGDRPRGGLMPELTNEQQERIEAIHDKHNDERAELTNRAKVLALDLQEMVGDGEPDFNGIERKLEEISKVRLDLMKLRLRIHKEIRPLLDEDQRTLFDRGLARVVGRGGMVDGRGMCGMCPMGGPGAMTGGRQMMGQRPMGRGMGQGMGPGMMRGGPPEDVEDDD
jgi:Spy/CpxP family protein refolding chaperone